MLRLVDDKSGTSIQHFVSMFEGRLSGANVTARQRILAEVTGLFLRIPASAQTAVLFDELFIRLTTGLAPQTLLPLAHGLASSAQPPLATLRMLASHEHAAVALPILAQSEALPGDDIAALAATVDAERLLAICSRKRIDKPLSAIIVARQNAAAMAQLLVNPGAAFTIPDFRAALGVAVSDARGRVDLRQPVDILDFAGRRGGRCMTRDISPGGIKIELAGGGRPPDSFMLELPGIGHARLTCRYVWHRDGMVGAMLSEPLFRQLDTQLR